MLQQRLFTDIIGADTSMSPPPQRYSSPERVSKGTESAHKLPSSIDEAMNLEGMTIQEIVK
jgi:hypothetical protein